MRGEPFEQHTIGRAVAVQAGHHERLQLFLIRRHAAAIFHSDETPFRLHGVPKNRFDMQCAETPITST